jgi:DNA-directed RNA polymerase subunit M/transcription elongation factor TFIIS
MKKCPECNGTVSPKKEIVSSGEFFRCQKCRALIATPKKTNRYKKK